MVRRGTVRCGVPRSAPIVVLLGAVACSRAERSKAPGAAVSDAMASARVEASPFVCDADRCVQRHVRLPDTGEWRCAEREGVVWCAGGEPAAGVVARPKQRGYTCGERRKSERGRRERVCVDAAPDYPPGPAGSFACRFTERGARECVRKGAPVRALVVLSKPNCWVDADCDGARCDRGTCAEAAP